MKSRHSKTVLCISAFLLAAQAAGAAQITFYENQGFRGRAFTTERQVENFRNFGFNDRASSVIVDSGRWEVCEDARYSGRCVVLRKGAYDSLQRMGVNDRVSSVRQVKGNRRDYVESPEPLAQANYDYRRRPNERVYEVPVASVRAVMGPPDRHCWTEREQVEERSRPSAGGAVVGAIIGGIIGHQIGSGRGNDVATVGGAVAGGAIGANAGRDRNTYEQDVRRCERVEGSPDYWDVAYDFHGVRHYVQMDSPPGRTILVNERGEPRQ